MEKKIIFYYTKNGKCPYLDWLNKLDMSLQLRIIKRIDRLKKGAYGDFKPLQNSKLSELRLDFGAGYRIYYYDIDDILVLFIAGSSKKEQVKTIKQASIYLDEFIERNNLK